MYVDFKSLYMQPTSKLKKSTKTDLILCKKKNK